MIPRPAETSRPTETGIARRRRRPFAVVALVAVVLALAGVGSSPVAGGGPDVESVFVPVWPCRLVNTQNSAGPLAAGEERFYRMHGNTSAQGGSASCGIPQEATALEVSITAVSAAGDGYLRTGSVQQALPTATFLNYSELMNITNTGTVKVSSNAESSFRIRVFVASTHVIVDVFGYYLAA